MKKNIVIIAGPTASGKTELGISLAKAIDGEIISADSMQIYKYMNIGTAKPTSIEMNGVPHHMIDIVFPDEEFSVALFRRLAGEYIDDITSRGKVPIILGGTGLYINSLTHNLDFSEAPENKELREFLANIAAEKGNEYVHEMLRNVDQESYNRLFPNDLKRVIRALEVFKITGKTISEVQKESREKPIDFNLAYFALSMDRNRLYDRVNLRVDKMFQFGLLEEVIMLREMGYGRDLKSIQGIGYKEVYDYLDGMFTLDEVKNIIKQSTRNYAKRQLTWFRRDERINWIDLDKLDRVEEILQNIISYVEGVFGKL